MESRINPRTLHDRLDWNLLRTFLVIAKERSISRAAAKLHLTQPAVSQALKRLEEQVGAVLAKRQSGQFEITAAGLSIRSLAEEIYANIAQFGEISGGGTDNPRDISGVVQLLVVSGISSTVYDDFLSQFHRDSPRVNLQIQVMRSADIISSLNQKLATAAIAPNIQLPPKIHHQFAVPQRFHFYCGAKHRLYGRNDLSLADLRTENLVAVPGDRIGGCFSKLTLFREQHGFSGQVLASSASMREMRRLIHAGYGIGCLPEAISRSDLEQKKLFRLPPYDGVVNIDLHLLWHSERNYSAAEIVFLDSLRAHLGRYADQPALTDVL